MNADEMGLLVRSVKALCPAQKFDEFTPDAWLDVVGDLDYDEAYEAMRSLARKQPFIGPSDIVSEIADTRRGRASWAPGAARAALEAAIPAADDPDDWRSYIRELRAGRTRQYGPEDLKPHPVEQAVESTFQRVESKWNRHAFTAPKPQLAIEPRKLPDDPQHALAVAILEQLPDAHLWLSRAAIDLEAEGVPLTKPAVAIRAADLATRPDGTPRAVPGPDGVVHAKPARPFSDERDSGNPSRPEQT